jgi:hypothetical protein
MGRAVYYGAVERCEQCGFDYDLGAALGAGAAILAGSREVAAILRSGDPDAVVRRPDASTWSTREYGCHLRDVLLVQRERVLLARREDRPSLTPMGRDERVEHDGYADQAPGDVARQLEDAAALFAHALSRLDAPAWERTVIYNYPEPAERTLRWVAVHTLHEVRHHAADIARERESSTITR